ncbi:3-hydroxyisobutyrate dehydrogenase [Prauserella marina]|uniref:3-hydroxyisobutyrate dehydrogenase n=1 Tax=Prauserella marina TaxID=530584 RepID=A0A222VSM7_9PSEU|nr:NAD(P)-dependent oxidoreductase [Prauserella marina]ASR36908.1 3-hydroxyisobutyrate dehydrogenase [Prauserella marina]PWV80150.1 3-hydroxyisobutyrate dehydrogenase [Prauserella marina]SDD48264.1 3-hydroxyisobutyrate dehydrogenase [Prauserella marina]
MTETSMTSIGFIGLGRMGLPMAGRLTSAGYRVLGFDLSEDALSRLTAEGGHAADDAAAAAAADIVVLMLPDSGAVEHVLGKADVAAALGEGTLVVDMSSSEPLRTRALAEKLRRQGVGLVDAPVSGGVRGAERGTLTIMVGGSDEEIARAEPVLGNLGTVVRAGGTGAGHAVKALNNLMSATHLWITSEAMHAGKGFGIDPEVMLAIVNGSSGRSGSTENKWPNFVLPGGYDSGFALRLMLKDMRIAADLSRAVGVEPVLGDDAISRWAAAADELAADADHTEIARWIADHAGEPSATEPKTADVPASRGIR